MRIIIIIFKQNKRIPMFYNKIIFTTKTKYV